MVLGVLAPVTYTKGFKRKFSQVGNAGVPNALLLTGRAAGEEGGGDEVVRHAVGNLFITLEPVGNPVLSLVRLNGVALLSWSAAAPGFRLYTTPKLMAPISWVAVTTPVVKHGATLSVVLPVEGGTRFYRLEK